jgi:hypothetical protein
MCKRAGALSCSYFLSFGNPYKVSFSRHYGRT